MEKCPISHKQRYPNPDSAWKTLNLLNSPRALFTHKRKAKGGTVYACLHCAGWHISGMKRESPKLRDWKTRQRPPSAWRFLAERSNWGEMHG